MLEVLKIARQSEREMIMRRKESERKGNEGRREKNGREKEGKL